jgi:tripartite-type tricarboxylate transporter receptor subunit TctC
MKKLTSITAAALAAGLVFHAATARAADSVADFYKGKTVTIYVGLAAGGLYSTFAQILARHMGKHIPGEPNVIVQHQPGAGGMIAANAVYNVLPKDGTILIGLNGGTTKRVVLGEPAARFDPRKWNWLGAWNEVVNDCTVWSDAPATTLEQAKTTELILGANDTGNATYTTPMIINAFLGTKFKVVPGYGGGAQVRLAMERGEVHGFCGQFEGWKSVKPEWLKAGRLAHLVQLATKRSPDMPNTPLLSEFARNDEEKRIFEFVQSGLDDRAMVTAPGVPADRVAALRKAYMDTLADKDFLAEANSQKFEINPITADELKAFVEKVFTLKPDAIAKIRKAQGLD